MADLWKAEAYVKDDNPIVDTGMMWGELQRFMNEMSLAGCVKFVVTKL